MLFLDQVKSCQEEKQEDLDELVEESTHEVKGVKTEVASLMNPVVVLTRLKPSQITSYGMYWPHKNKRNENSWMQ